MVSIQCNTKNMPWKINTIITISNAVNDPNVVVNLLSEDDNIGIQKLIRITLNGTPRRPTTPEFSLYRKPLCFTWNQ